MASHVHATSQKPSHSTDLPSSLSPRNSAAPSWHALATRPGSWADGDETRRNSMLSPAASEKFQEGEETRRNSMSLSTMDEKLREEEAQFKQQARCIQCQRELEHGLCNICRLNPRDDEEAAIETVKTRDYGAHQEDSTLVFWDGDNDPARPMKMSALKKWSIVATTGFMTFCVSFASSIFSTTIFVTGAEFGVSSEVMLLGLSLYVLGFALGPLIWGPLSEVYGRTRPLFFGMAVFCIFQVPVAVAQNLETIFLCRFLAGVFGSAPLAIIGGMYVDFMEPIERGMATSIFAGAVFVGPVAGPVVGSFITESYLGWRWTAWITLIVSAFFTIVAWLVTPETCEAVLLKWKAQKLRNETKNWALHSKSEEKPVTANSLVTKYLMKPLQMIVREPILIILTLYMSLVYGILYLTFEAYPISFESDRGWSPTLASLPFIGILIGVLLACLTIGIHSRTWYAKRLIRSGKLNPEDRMGPMIGGAIILPIGLFWFAWTSHPATTWVPQVLAGIPIGMGIILVFMSGVVYMVDVYLLNANSAVAINTFVRSGVAAGFPMFATYMYDKLGVDWATSLLGFICIALIPFPIVFLVFGATIRSWSKFAFVLE